MQQETTGQLYQRGNQTLPKTQMSILPPHLLYINNNNMGPNNYTYKICNTLYLLIGKEHEICHLHNYSLFPLRFIPIYLNPTSLKSLHACDELSCSSWKLVPYNKMYYSWKVLADCSEASWQVFYSQKKNAHLSFIPPLLYACFRFIQ